MRYLYKYILNTSFDFDVFMQDLMSQTTQPLLTVMDLDSMSH